MLCTGTAPEKGSDHELDQEEQDLRARVDAEAQPTESAAERYVQRSQARERPKENRDAEADSSVK